MSTKRIWQILICAIVILAEGSTALAKGPLRVHPTNPRYFADGDGKVVYLTGIQFEESLRDDGTLPPGTLDYADFLKTVERYNLNFIRLWRWSELFRYRYDDKDAFTSSYMPYERTGPGLALDGRSKFDLNRFDQTFFDRIRSRVIAARDRGFYVSIMLFEGHAVANSKLPWRWDGHPFNKKNNVDGIEADANGDGTGLEVHTLQVSAVTKIQEAYVRKVVDTVNDLDNVLYEVTNETASHSTEWQYHIIRYLKKYEAAKPKQHPVGMSFQFPGGSNKALFESPADFIAPNQEGGYRDNPPAADGAKVILSDTDHLGGAPLGKDWVWKSFVQGINPIEYGLMALGHLRDKPVAHEEAARAMGCTRTLANRINLAAMLPRPGLASSGYCLTDSAKEYVVYLPTGGEVTVDLTGAPGPFAVEWLHPVKGTSTSGERVGSGGKLRFKAPFGGDAVLYLRGR